MSNPFKVTEPTCISFSGGRTSAFMLYKVLEAHDGKLPDDAVVCFANTGKEDEATLKFVHDCEENWGININWVEYRNSEAGFDLVNYETASRNGEPYEQLIDKKKYLPNAVTRFCSHELKNKPIHAFCGIEDDQVMVGVRYDEPHRHAKMKSRGFLLPLIQLKITKHHINEFWSKQPFDLSLPIIDGLTNLGNCDLCFLKDFDVIMSNVRQNPNRAIWWAKQEEKIKATFHKSRPKYSKMFEFANSQIDFVGYYEDGIPCFCGD